MKTIEGCEDLLSKIEKAQFNFSEQTICNQTMPATTLLRNALIAYNYICSLENTNIKKELLTKLDSVMKEKLSAINPKLTDQVLEKIISYYKRGYFQYPLDVYVLQDVVFSKEAVFNDFGVLYKIKTFMYDNDGTYFNILEGIDFKVNANLFETFKKDYIHLNREQNIEFTKFICDNINSILYERFGVLAVRPLHDIDSNDSSNIILFEISNLNIFMDKRYPELAQAYYKKEELDIKLVVRNGENILIYYISQMIKDEKTIWELISVEEEVWVLSKSAMEYEQNIHTLKRNLQNKK